MITHQACQLHTAEGGLMTLTVVATVQVLAAVLFNYKNVTIGTQSHGDPHTYTVL